MFISRMRQTLRLIVIVVVVSQPAPSTSQSVVPVQVPLVDYPYTFNAANPYPSMQQSLQISASFYHVGASGSDWLSRKLVKGEEHEVERFILRGLFDLSALIVSVYLPGGYGWVHEEYHAGVCRIHGISCKNQVNRFPLFKDFISVNGVADSDLMRMKSEQPIDFVRMSSAGLESGLELSKALQVNQFTEETRPLTLIYWLAAYHTRSYISSASKNTIGYDERYREETNAAKHDIIGWDPLAWVYDLFRPSEAYEARGLHPSGIGIDRYITSGKLTDEESDYLRKQARLTGINFIDPFLFGITSIRLTDQVAFNSNVKHYITSFGHAIHANVFLKLRDHKLLFTWLNQKNFVKYHPGFDLQVFDLPVKDKWRVTPRVMVWSQPKRQAFRTEDSKVGYLISTNLRYEATAVSSFFLSLEYKTEGWVASNPYTSTQFSTRFGLALYPVF